MTSNNQNINIGDLDFDRIKSNLKEYLRGQTQFTDFDFEGAGINVLLDVLSQNTHYLGWYANMVANEAFLDTATTRDGVVSLSKLLGYTPRSKTAAKATVNINFGTTRPTIGGQNFDYLPTGTSFRGKVDRTTYNFLTRKPYELTINTSNQYVINNIEITEGSVSAINYVIDESNSDQRLRIPNIDVDTSTLVVRVQKSIQDLTGFTDNWIRNTDFSNLDSDSLVYFIEECEDEYYRIYFGDGIIGRKPRHGNYVTIQYLTSNGKDVNGLGKNDKATNRVFSAVSFPQATVSVVSAAAGGADKEGITSIKYNAPRAFQAQERAVTANDYRVIINQNYPNADSVHVYGGEDADPPVYGKVFIAVKPKEGTSLTDIEKSNLANNIIGTRNILGIIPEIVDPDILYVKVTTKVTYNPSLTTLSDTGIENLVTGVIQSYSTNVLNKFDRDLIHSHFTKTIDAGNPSIIGNQTTLMLQKRINVSLGQAASYELNFDNELFHPEDYYKTIITSTEFSYPDGSSSSTCYLDDDGDGIIRIYKLVNGSKVYVSEDIGTIDYTTGKLNLIDFIPTGLSGQTSTIRINVQPANSNINTRRNTILVIDSSDTTAISVDATPRNVTTDFSSVSGTPFPFGV